jgi:beta-hydroxyacyl-ACP dehydratase FabZ
MGEIVIDNIEIQSILPHRYPFLLVDRVVELEINEKAVGVKNISVNEPFFQGHFPGRPIFPGVLILEALAQLGAILAIRSIQGNTRPLIYLTGIDKTKFRKPVVPGDQLRLQVTVVKRRPPFWKMAGKAFVGEDLVCEAESTAMVTIESES